jgi:hypothetical protein
MKEVYTYGVSSGIEGAVWKTAQYQVTNWKVRSVHVFGRYPKEHIKLKSDSTWKTDIFNHLVQHVPDKPALSLYTTEHLCGLV